MRQQLWLATMYGLPIIFACLLSRKRQLLPQRFFTRPLF